MNRLWGHVAFRLALGYGLLALGSMCVVSAAFYFGTVGVLARGTDGNLISLSQRLARHYESRGGEGLRQEIQQLLADGIDQDTEVYLLVAPDGRKIVGNISGWTIGMASLDSLTDLKVVRDGRPSLSRLLPRLLPDGSILVVGRDMQDRREIEQLVWRALLAGGAVALLLAIGGALVFRRRLEHRVGAIRRTALEIEAGDLSRRIPISDVGDEFARLSRDINRMLDRIEQLMSGVRHVSNAIAHDLRTPLGRVRARIDAALSREKTVPALSDAARTAIDGIDDLILLLNKLLQIAEAESGVRAQSFERVELNGILRDMVELYDAAAEEAGVQLSISSEAPVWAHGDRDLLVTAVASLIDNALKYAGRGTQVVLSARSETQSASIVVQDNGRGVPDSELPRLTERFYRVDQARNQPGNGLGLAIVAAIATLHGGKLQLANAEPGLRASIWLPEAKPPEIERPVTARAAAG